MISYLWSVKYFHIICVSHGHKNNINNHLRLVRSWDLSFQVYKLLINVAKSVF